MKRSIREVALRSLTSHRATLDNVRRHLRVQLRDALTPEGAKDVDALLLATDKLLLTEQRAVASADEEEEDRSEEQQAADAKAAAVRGPT